MFPILLPLSLKCLGPRNRKRCRQTGSRQSTPLSTIRTRYGNSVSTPRTHTDWQKQAEFSPKGKPIRNFSYRPHIVDTDTDCGRHFCGRHFRDSQKGFSLENRAGPKGVSTKGVSMKRSNLLSFGSFYTAVSKRNWQKSP